MLHEPWASASAKYPSAQAVHESTHVLALGWYRPFAHAPALSAAHV
jgi:hypothetical protein